MTPQFSYRTEFLIKQHIFTIRPFVVFSSQMLQKQIDVTSKLLKSGMWIQKTIRMRLTGRENHTDKSPDDIEFMDDHYHQAPSTILHHPYPFPCFTSSLTGQSCPPIFHSLHIPCTNAFWSFLSPTWSVLSNMNQYLRQ